MEKGITFVANRPFTTKGKSYRRGDPIGSKIVKELGEHKVGQLLDQRWIRPSMAGESVTPTPTK